MSPLISALEVVYVLCMIMLAVYGLNSLLLTVIYLRGRYRSEGESSSWPPSPGRSWPSVTVQLPIYNEQHVVERLITAVAQLDYPLHKLQIQILDDSTDETQIIARQEAERWRREGLDIEYIHRQQRTGFKAGALAAGLARAKGELVAILDADFLPQRDFLRRVVPCFDDPRVGCVQARWEHLNADYSLLTRVQAIGIDAHFIVEQKARSQAGLFINFNGTAGIWRMTCIKAAGGWRVDTLTEDLDLSYRAQLAGWRLLFLPDVFVPAEVPAQIDAMKRQQFRWAKGSIQTAKKLLWPLLKSRQPLTVKVEGVIHLTNYLVHPFMLLLLLLVLPLTLANSALFDLPPYFLLAAIGPPTMCVVSQRERGGSWWQRLKFFALLMMLGTGLSLSNTKAALEAIIGLGSDFRRTPKFAIRSRSDCWQKSAYSLPSNPLVWTELALSLFSLSMFLFAVGSQNWGLTPWTIIYAAGYSYVAGLSLHQSWQRRRYLRTSHSSAEAR